MRLAHDRKGFTLIELLVVIAIIAILAAILFPVFSAVRARARTATCQSNMLQISKALMSYVSDWWDTFPTNRTFGGTLKPEIRLTTLDPNGNPVVDPTNCGPNWVEGLYKYTDPASLNPADQTHWTCPSASTAPKSATAGYGSTTYALNYNLVESGLSAVKIPGSTMLVREMDRRCGAICRPCKPLLTSDTSVDKNDKAVFLTTYDGGWGGSFPTNPKLHGTGSHILFIDGHVKGFSRIMMPLDASLKWVDGQWWNSDVPAMKQIAISP